MSLEKLFRKEILQEIAFTCSIMAEDCVDSNYNLDSIFNILKRSLRWENVHYLWLNINSKLTLFKKNYFNYLEK